jgi:hypothetical protein
MVLGAAAIGTGSLRVNEDGDGMNCIDNQLFRTVLTINSIPPFSWGNFYKAPGLSYACSPFAKTVINHPLSAVSCKILYRS